MITGFLSAALFSFGVYSPSLTMSRKIDNYQVGAHLFYVGPFWPFRGPFGPLCPGSHQRHGLPALLPAPQLVCRRCACVVVERNFLTMHAPTPPRPHCMQIYLRKITADTVAQVDRAHARATVLLGAAPNATVVVRARGLLDWHNVAWRLVTSSPGGGGTGLPLPHFADPCLNTPPKRANRSRLAL
jgi:hypothetical protein